MTETTDVYRRLQKHIDNMPIPFPATESGIEIELLKHLFSSKEAEIALALSMVPEPVEKILRRLPGMAITKRELEHSLNAMAKNGSILAETKSTKGTSVRQYSKAPLVVGMFEFQVNHINKELVEDFHTYMDEAFRSSLSEQKTQQMRSVPINTKIVSNKVVGLYDDVRQYIKSSEGPFSVLNCVCRQANEAIGKSCGRNEIKETCLGIGDMARLVIANGQGRAVSQDEFLSLLDRAEIEGLVLNPENTQNPRYICCCCGDCCELLQNAKKLPRPVDFISGNYFAAVDPEKCTSCKRCVSRCQMDAITVSNECASVDLDRCIGCGLCATTCEPMAISLHAKSKAEVPAKDADAMYQKILMRRYGAWGGMKVAAKIMLGRKV